jgi:nucleoside-triphosphatase
VRRYGVDLAAFERVALPALEDAKRADVVVLDELGKMELASERFRNATLERFERDVPVVATTHVYAHPFTDALKRRAGVERARVKRESRDALPRRLAARVGS